MTKPHLDVKQSGSKQFVQRIIWDDGRDWTSAELSLLEVGAKTVSHSGLKRELQRIVA